MGRKLSEISVILHCQHSLSLERKGIWKTEDKKELIGASSRENDEYIAVAVNWLAHQYLSMATDFISFPMVAPLLHSLPVDSSSHSRFSKTIQLPRYCPDESVIHSSTTVPYTDTMLSRSRND
jgi:hypothetical protein